MSQFFAPFIYFGLKIEIIIFLIFLLFKKNLFLLNIQNIKKFLASFIKTFYYYYLQKSTYKENYIISLSKGYNGLKRWVGSNSTAKLFLFKIPSFSLFDIIPHLIIEIFHIVFFLKVNYIFVNSLRTVFSAFIFIVTFNLKSNFNLIFLIFWLIDYINDHGLFLNNIA